MKKKFKNFISEMDDLKKKKIIYGFLEIIKDFFILNVQIFFCTVACSVCAEHGWFSSFHTEVTPDAFWNFYKCISVFIPLIMFYRAARGKYNVKMRKGYTRVTENSDTGTKHDTRGI